ncbi:DUF445 family protein [Longirhabdus pacifica]|uniref:DUF445 family protein n=1 Tax=Longirhabdus pacifica TaxID=2305227 RepID=UPI00100909F8|nr:DUF445 family protein [Longirhabdus pacifica]
MLWVGIFILVGALIGAFTNFLAIKMLFHPRTEKRIFNKKVPLTPGLIPKRQEEIAVSLGDIVGEYLVTSAGIKNVVNGVHFKEQVHDEIIKKVEDWSDKDMTIEDVLIDLFGDDSLADALQSMESLALGMVENGVNTVWDRYEMKERTVASILPSSFAVKKEEWIESVVDHITDALQEALQSEQGTRMLSHVSNQLLDKAGGFWGSLASVFVDEQKMMSKIKPALIEQLNSNIVKNLLHTLLEEQWHRLEEKKITDIMEMLSDQESKQWLLSTCKQFVQQREWKEKVLQYRWKHIITSHYTVMENVVQRIVGMTFTLFQHNVDKMLKLINLPQMVANEVRSFPIEQLESMIVRIARKELRAITFLGAVLGGIIGLFQSVIYFVT